MSLFWYRASFLLWTSLADIVIPFRISCLPSDIGLFFLISDLSCDIRLRFWYRASSSLISDFFGSIDLAFWYWTSFSDVRLLFWYWPSFLLSDFSSNVGVLFWYRTSILTSDFFAEFYPDILASTKLRDFCPRSDLRSDAYRTSSLMRPSETVRKW